MYSTCLHVPQAIYFWHATEKRFVKILVELCSATRREQVKPRSMTLSSVYLLFVLLTWSWKMFYFLCCKEVPTASKTPIGLGNMVWGKGVPDLKSGDCFMYLSWSLSTSCKISLVLLWSVFIAAGGSKKKWFWEQSELGAKFKSRKTEKIFGLCRWPAEIRNLTLMWHNSSTKEITSTFGNDQEVQKWSSQILMS